MKFYLHSLILLLMLMGSLPLAMKAQEGNVGYTYYDSEKTVVRERYFLNENGEKEGDYEQFTREGKVLERGSFAHDKAQGTWLFFDEATGNILRSVTFNQDTLDGPFTLFSPDSVVTQAGQYQKGELADTVFFYYQGGGLQAKGRLLQGKRVGIWYYFHDKGGLRMAVPFVSDTVSGIIEEFYPDGTLKQVQRREMGKRESSFAMYYPNGKIQQKGTYVHDTLDGPVLKYHPDSILQTRTQLEMGTRIGPFEEFWPNGRAKETGNYENGKRNGRFDSYYENGKFQTIVNYRNDTVEGPFKVYHSNGKVKQETNYKNGKPEGRIVTYYENGRMESEGNMKNGLPVGKWRHYYANGVLKREGTFDQQGVLIGDFQEYTPKGKPGAAKE